MEITASTAYAGPSVHARCPVVHFSLGGLEGDSGQRVDDAALDALFALLPKLRANLESCRASLPPRGNGGSDTGHVFEHVCIELQNAVGCQLECTRLDANAHPDAAAAAVPFEESRVCISAAELAVEMMNRAMPGFEPTDDPDDPWIFTARLDTLAALAQRRMLPVQDRAMIRTARARGIPVTQLVRRLLILGQGRYQKRLSATKTSLTNVIGNDLAANKDYAKRLLGSIGLPVGTYERVYRSKAAVAAARRIGFPVVVKPNDGKMGGGVSVGMKNAREVRAAYKRAREYSRSVLVEQFVEGFDYRMIVIDGKLCAAAHRVPAHIVGDGVQNVGQLIAEVNSDPRRGVGPRFSWTRIRIDDQAMRLLQDLNYTLESVPSKGETIYLRRNANTSDGGTAVDVTDIVHPDNRAIAERAARSIGLDIAGVDLLTRDISRSMLENGGTICEINSRPGLRKHIWPAQGKPRDVLGPIMDMLFPPGARSRLNVVAVTGTGDREGAARRLAQALSADGNCVGVAAAGQVHIAGTRIGPDGLTAHEACRMVLLDPDVDTAVFDVDPADILQSGLGFDSCDLCVVLSGDGPLERATVSNRDAAVDAAVAVAVRAARRVVRLADGDDVVASSAQAMQWLGGVEPGIDRPQRAGHRRQHVDASETVYPARRRNVGLGQPPSPSD